MGIDGTYKITITTPMGNQEMDVTFVTSGKVPTGNVVMKGKEEGIEQLKVDGNNFSFVVSMNGPIGQTKAKLQGKMEGDNITGFMKMPFGKAPFEGARVGSSAAGKKSLIRRRPPAQVDERIFTGGVDFNDYFRLMKRTEEQGEDWVDACEELGDYDFKYAEEQLALGHKETARYFFQSAGAIYRLGQYGLNDMTEEKTRMYNKILDSTAKQAALSDPPFEEVHIPYKDYVMDGWLVVPKNVTGNPPVVIMISGATGFKEETLFMGQHWVDRGVAVLFIDGPGQGSTLYFNKGYLQIDVEDAYSTMIDWLIDTGRFGKIGISGGSTGGYYVPRAAAADKRIAACSVNAGSYNVVEILDNAPIYKHKFANLFGVADEEMDNLFPQMSLEGICEKMECPFLVLHGTDDPIFNVSSAQKMYDHSGSKDKTLKIYENSGHCCTGFDNEAWRFIADWFADKLDAE